MSDRKRKRSASDVDGTQNAVGDGPNPKRAARDCGICGAVFAANEVLYAHVKGVHVAAWTKGQACGWRGCDKRPKGCRYNYELHMRMHSGQRPFICGMVLPDGTVCTQAFAHRAACKDHKRIHTNERPHACDMVLPDGSVCAKAFTDSSTCIKHRRTHTGERPFVCGTEMPDGSVCSQAFARSGDCTIHKRIHTGERSYVCGTELPDGSVCNQAFKQRGHCTSHKRTHTGPFCTTCGRYCVPKEGMICGFCAMGSTYGKKERTVFQALAQADWRLCQFVRDQALGCGNRRRPDGYVALHAQPEESPMLFIVEVDEHQHRNYEVSCELKRLEEIQQRHGGPVFVLRYNPDQPDGLSDDALSALAARCIDVLDGDHVLAQEAFGGLYVEYHGYTAARVEAVERDWFSQQL